MNKMICPYCKSVNTVLSGNAKDGRQRIKCNTCGRRPILNTNRRAKITENERGFKRCIVISDSHAGHFYGLTPPMYFTSESNSDALRFQKESWTWFTNALNIFKPFDICFANGDLLDGKQRKSGGSELSHPLLTTQVEIASKIMETINAKSNYIIKGTPYHVGSEDDYESFVAKNIGCSIHNNLKIDVNGCILDFKHKISNSSTPQGDATALLRAGMWEDLKSSNEDERPNIIIRSHRHRHVFAGFGNNRYSMITPSLQGHSDYGAKECEGKTHFGFIIIDIDNSGIFDVKNVIVELESLKRETIIHK